MRRIWLGGMAAIVAGLAAGSLLRVGTVTPSGIVVATAQIVDGAGTQWDIGARPLDIVGFGNRIFIKATDAILEISAATGKVVKKVEIKSASLHGLALSPDHKTLLATDAGARLYILDVSGELAIKSHIDFPAAAADGGQPYPCGVAASPDGRTAFVCLSRSNLLARVDLAEGKFIDAVPVDPAPYDVAVSGNRAVVTCWGRTPKSGDLTMSASGTPVQIDDRGIASGGSVCFVDLESKGVTRVDTGGQPSQIVLSEDGKATVVCANGDLVSQWDVAGRRQDWSVRLTADKLSLTGLAPNALALSADRRTIYVPCGGLNAVAVIDRASRRVKGFVPTDWYPIGILATSGDLYIVNGKGIGSRSKPLADHQKSVYDFTGTVTHVSLPIADLAGLTRQSMKLASSLSDTRGLPRASPLEGGPAKSPIKHVFYVIKENRTYDQLLGDMPQADGDPKLTIYGRAVTPNTHAIAEQFVLLDNFYCNGVLSADGHAWAVEGNATSYFERAFGGWTRSYPFGDDPLSPNISGFIWNDALAHRVTFRNYGEFDYAETKQSFRHNLADLAGGKETAFDQKINTVSLIPYSERSYPGWNMEIPDQVRASRFIADFKRLEKRGAVPQLNVIYLPEDHTGASVSANTCVADNDRGLGMVVEAISHSSLWASSAIFVVEDDPQAGFDHVDGHRSPCLVVSPYTRRREVIKDFYNQSSVLHTIETILGLPPMNWMDGHAPVMTTCFQSRPDLTPYDAMPMEVKVALASPQERAAHWDVSKPDLINEDKANRLLWNLARPREPYPASFAGPHGRGLAARGLRLAKVNPGAPADPSDD